MGVTGIRYDGYVREPTPHGEGMFHIRASYLRYSSMVVRWFEEISAVRSIVLENLFDQ